MKKVYIILMHTNTIPSRLVKITTKYMYSHVGLSFDKNCDVIYSFGRKKINNPLNGGFTKLDRSSKFWEKFSETLCRIYELEVQDEQYEKVLDYIDNMLINEKKLKYDFLGAFLRFLKFPVHFKNKYVCSYFVAETLEYTGIYSFHKQTYFVIPKDFENIMNAKIIYEGKYMR